MVKHTQTICRPIADELFECIRPFSEIGTKRINKELKNWSIDIRIPRPVKKVFKKKTTIEILDHSARTTKYLCIKGVFDSIDFQVQRRAGYLLTSLQLKWRHQLFLQRCEYLRSLLLRFNLAVIESNSFYLMNL